MTDEHSLSEVKVWDHSIRVFHWVNVLCVLALMIIGSAILYANALGISSDGKITLKIMHAYIGYVFAFNLIWRLVGLLPGAKEVLDPEGYAAMRTFREPFIALHKLFFWLMLSAAVLHVLAVVVEEVRHGNGIISAMITGKKIMRKSSSDT